MTMKLLLKFNLVFIVLFAAGIGAAGYVSWNLLQRNAQTEIVDTAKLLMEKAIAVRNYTSNEIKPLLETQMKYTFLPQSVPAYGATEILSDLRRKYPEFSYKEATLNPTNPRDRAVEWEADVINRFRNQGGSELQGERDTPTGRSLFVARPLTVSSEGCLPCHSTVEAAPRPMVDKYGPANGFGWNLHEVIGAQIVSVPTAVPFKRARQTFDVFMLSLAGVLVGVGVALNVLLWWMVIRPVTRLSALADRISLGELDAPDLRVSGRDEIRTLSESVSRMRKSLQQAMKMLEA
jgi:protein-histidine pros-kinase